MEELTIPFQSGQYRVTAIKKKTTAYGFCDIKEGDCIYFTCEFKRTVGSRGIHALYVYVFSLSGKGITVVSQNELFQRLECFEIEPIT
jgi:hypothetical protein